jgi:DNA topoisomerase-1
LSSFKKRKQQHSDNVNGSAKKKAKIKKEDNVNGDKKPKAKVKKEDSGDRKPKALKKLEKTERLQYGMQSFLWWEAHDPPPGCQWDTMEHAGVSFPEPYVTHGVKMLYDGKPVDLTPIQEEA